MLNDAEPLRVQVQTVQAITGVPLADVGVEAVVFGAGTDRGQRRRHPGPSARPMAAAAARSAGAWAGGGRRGLPCGSWRRGPGRPGGETPSPGAACRPTRRHQEGAPDDLANDLRAPTADSIVRLLTAGERARLLSKLEQALESAGAGEGVAAIPLLDPEAIRAGDVRIVPIRELPHVDLNSSRYRMLTC